MAPMPSALCHLPLSKFLRSRIQSRTANFALRNAAAHAEEVVLPVLVEQRAVDQSVDREAEREGSSPMP